MTGRLARHLVLGALLGLAAGLSSALGAVVGLAIGWGTALLLALALGVTRGADLLAVLIPLPFALGCAAYVAAAALDEVCVGAGLEPEAVRRPFVRRWTALLHLGPLVCGLAVLGARLLSGAGGDWVPPPLGVLGAATAGLLLAGVGAARDLDWACVRAREAHRAPGTRPIADEPLRCPVRNEGEAT